MRISALLSLPRQHVSHDCLTATGPWAAKGVGPPHALPLLLHGAGKRWSCERGVRICQSLSLFKWSRQAGGLGWHGARESSGIKRGIANTMTTVGRHQRLAGREGRDEGVIGVTRAMRTLATLSAVLFLVSGVLWLTPGAIPQAYAQSTATPVTTYDRIRQSELLGEQGAEAYCRTRGYKPLLKWTEKSYRHGYDQVWFDPVTKDIICIEAKGNSGKLLPRQGSITSVIEDAERMLRSPRTNPGERKTAQFVLEAAENGRIRWELVRTTQNRTYVEKVVHPMPYDRSRAAGVLRTLEQEGKLVLPRGTYRRTFGAGHAANDLVDGLRSAGGLETPRTPNSTAPARSYGVQSLDEAFESIDDVAQAPSNARRAVRGGSRAVRAAEFADEVGEAATGAAALGRATRIVRAFERTAGVVAVAAEAGIAGYEVYKTETAYRRGDISYHERVRRHVRTGGRAVGGSAGGFAGAWAGAQAGAAAGSVFGPAGTVVGGVGGAVVGAVAGSKVGEKLGDMAAKVWDWFGR